jgi:transcriptional regulator
MEGVMYAPQQFREDRQDVLLDVIRDIQLAAIVTPAADGLHATHAPVVVRQEEDRIILETHVARANDHWRLAGAKSLMMFQGPHSYIHPGWYETKRETGKVVPTWTYVVVHAHGTLSAFDGRDDLVAHVTALTEQNEQRRSDAWAVTDAPNQYIDRMTRGIVGLRLEVERLEGSWKLNQHKSEGDKRGVTAGLAEEDDANARAVSALMRGLGHDKTPAA